MIRYIFLVFSTIVLATAHDVCSQILPTDIHETVLKGRIKQIDEFICRFNMTESWEGKAILDRSDTLLRRKYLMTLFDYDRFRQGDGTFMDKVGRFIDIVVAHDYQIHYEDTTWVAEVQCDATIGTIRQTIVLYLKTMKRSAHEYTWVINRVGGQFFDSCPTDSAACPFISPMEHEIGFIGLLGNLAIARSLAADFLHCSDDLRLGQFLAHALLLAYRIITFAAFAKQSAQAPDGFTGMPEPKVVYCLAPAFFSRSMSYRSWPIFRTSWRASLRSSE